MKRKPMSNFQLPFLFLLFVGLFVFVFFTFACIRKSFTIAIPDFFPLLFLIVTISGRIGKKLKYFLSVVLVDTPENYLVCVGDTICFKNKQ